MDQLDDAAQWTLLAQLIDPMRKARADEKEFRLSSDAQIELDALPSRERLAVDNAMKKLEAIGSNLGYSHSSAVKGR